MAGGRVYSFRFPARRPDAEKYFFDSLSDRDRVDIIMDAIDRDMKRRPDQLRDRIKKAENEILKMRADLKLIEAQQDRERRARLESFDADSFYVHVDNMVRNGRLVDAEAHIQEAIDAGLVDRARATERLEQIRKGVIS